MIAGHDYQVVRFNPEKHGAFVYDSFRLSLRHQFPWCHVPAGILLDQLKRTLASPGTAALVAEVDVSDEPADLIAGWCVGVPAGNEVVYGFTRYSMRRMGIGSTLALTAGVDLTKPVDVRYWTRAAERISKRPGYRLAFSICGFEAAA